MYELLLENKSVLVAEDNTINQLVVKHTLTKLGAKVDIAIDGVEAIEKLQANKYDCILMDIQMPQMDGYETSQYIRKQLKSNIPIIAMTALALKGEDEKCFEFGMDGYVSKPFTIDSLYAAINKVFSNPKVSSTNENILGNEEVLVDISMLYQIAGDDESYIHTMISTFLENMPLTIKKMENNIIDEDWEALHRSAHYAKSSLSVIKINDMFKWVEKIEQIGKTQTNLNLLTTLMPLVKTKFDKAEKMLEQKFRLQTSKVLTT